MITLLSIERYCELEDVIKCKFHCNIIRVSYRAWLHEFSPRDACDPERGSRISSRAGIEKQNHIE